jgi:hypothetical protein
LLCEANTVEEINAMIAQLSMAQAGVMQFEVIPLLRTQAPQNFSPNNHLSSSPQKFHEPPF